MLTVIICTRNRAAILKESIQSLLTQKASCPFEVLIVDDGSSDETHSIVNGLASESGSLSLRYTFQAHKGLNAARNLGLRNSNSEFVLFFDDDELAPPDFIERVYQSFLKHQDVQAIGGPLKDTNKSGLRTCRKCSLASVNVSGKGERMVKRLIGGNMAFRARVFNEVGGFDESLSGRGDETEWFLRAKGHKFLFDPDLWVWHRRDHLNLSGLCRHAFIQGLAVPAFKKRIGSQYRIKPIRIVRLLGHSVIHRCARGMVLTFREFGAIAGKLKLAFNRG
jgi:glycosyltransferase involved in cell wall biosynthesis